MQICWKIETIRVNACTGPCQPGADRKETSQKTAKEISTPDTDLDLLGQFHSIHSCGSISEAFFTLFFNFLFGNGKKME